MMQFRTAAVGRAFALVAGSSLLVLSAADSARADAYVYSTQSLSNVTVNGSPASPLATLSQDQATLGGGPTTAIGGPTDASQAYFGPPASAPAENTFTAKGQTTPDYIRGDSLVGTSPLTMQTVAETFLTSGTTSNASGSWEIGIQTIVSSPGPISVGFTYSNPLSLIDTGSPGTSVNLQATHSFSMIVRDLSNNIVFQSNPAALNTLETRTTAGTTNLPGSGSLTLTSGTLAPSFYSITLTGSTTVNASLVPEPTAGVALVAAAATTVLARRRRRRVV